MNIIDTSAHKIAIKITQHHPGSASYAVLFYSLSLLINTMIAIIMSLAISFFTTKFLETLTVIFFFILLRYFSGGLHLKSSLACCIFSICVFLFSSHLDYPFDFIGFFLNVFSIIILIFTAPYGLENISKIDQKYYPLLKVASILIVSINFYLKFSYLSTSFFIQSLLTLSSIETVVLQLEKKITKRG